MEESLINLGTGSEPATQAQQVILAVAFIRLCTFYYVAAAPAHPPGGTYTGRSPQSGFWDTLIIRFNSPFTAPVPQMPSR